MEQIMKDKFLSLAEKMGINQEIIEKIKEDFNKPQEEAVKVTTVEVEKAPTEE
jgi:hypothetical protein